MDAVLQSLIRQFIASPSNDLAHKIANNVVRTNPENPTFEQKIATYNETVETLNAELGDAVGDEVQNLIASLADEGVVGIRWEQYTPYFNDGEPCVFSVYEPRVRFKGDDEESGEYGDSYLSTYDLDYDWDGDRQRVYKTEKDIQRAEIIDKAKNFIKNIPNDIMLSAFGDHKKITVTASDIDEDHYEHD